MTTLIVGDARQFGAIIRDARLREGLSQAELASEAGVGRQWLVGLEAGDKESAPLDMVLRLLRALEMDVTLSGAAPERRFGDDEPPLPTASEILARYGGGR